MFSELAGLAIGNLFRARARLAMTAGGVVVGTSAVILLVGKMKSLKSNKFFPKMTRPISLLSAMTEWENTP